MHRQNTLLHNFHLVIIGCKCLRSDPALGCRIDYSMRLNMSCASRYIYILWVALARLIIIDISTFTSHGYRVIYMYEYVLTMPV